MITYIVIKNNFGENCSVTRSDNACIPLAKENSDYQQFKKDIANGAELQDSTGAVMTASQIQAFIATLP